MKKSLYLLFLISAFVSFGQTKQKNQKEAKKPIVIERNDSNENNVAEPVPDIIYVTDAPANAPEDAIYYPASIEVKPEFPGGPEAMKMYIRHRYIVPENLQVENFRGKIFLSMIVEKDGSLTNLKIIKEICDGSGKELIRVVKGMPKWIPGKQNGKAVRCYAYIIFEIEYTSKNTK